MWTINAYNSLDDYRYKTPDDKPAKITKKDNRKSAEFIAMQLNNKYAFVDVLDPDGNSVFAILFMPLEK